MNVFRAIDQELRTELVTQVSAGILVALVLVLVISWPVGPLVANNTWFTVAAARRLLLALLALYLGYARSRAPAGARLATCLTLVVLSLVTAPFEVLAFMVSHPLASLPFSLVLTVALPVAVYGAALLLAAWLGRVRAAWLAVPLVPLLLTALGLVDEVLDRLLFTPFAVATPAAAGNVAFWSCLAVATLVMLSVGAGVARRHPEAVPAGGGGS